MRFYAKLPVFKRLKGYSYWFDPKTARVMGRLNKRGAPSKVYVAVITNLQNVPRGRIITLRKDYTLWVLDIPKKSGRPKKEVIEAKKKKYREFLIAQAKKNFPKCKDKRLAAQRKRRGKSFIQQYGPEKAAEISKKISERMKGNRNNRFC